VTTADPWAAWLLERRHGGDERSLAETLELLAPIRDRVLDNARVEPGETLLDVGCGDGLIAFGALKRGANVVFSDISKELLDVCREIAGDDERCTFVKASATDLSAVPDASVDAVTMRSVLIYVADRERAFAEFRRVLKPGGRLSIFEPLNSFEYPGPDDRWGAWDVGEVRELADRVKGVFRAIHDREGNTMHDFVATDFVELAEQAGFAEVHADASYVVSPATRSFETWETYENSSGNPLVPTLREAADSVLTTEESERFRGHLRRQAESGEGIERGATLYLWAVKG
jgi:ubiquinone/menaquinone biosynthesis C-methylase UbiE